MPNTDDDDQGLHKVVLNGEEQYSVWPNHRDNVPGWRDAGMVGSKQECLESIGRHWTDLRPLSLRRHMGELQSSAAVIKSFERREAQAKNVVADRQVEMPPLVAGEIEFARAHSQGVEAEPQCMMSKLGTSEESWQSKTIVARTDRNGPIPLSHEQERLWFQDQIGDHAAYNVFWATRLDGPLDVEALEHSLADLLRRQESLRTRFVMQEGVPLQVIDPPRTIAIHTFALDSLASAAQRELHLKELMLHEQQHRFDLASGPLLSSALAKLAADVHVLMVTIHHIAADGWSREVLLGELMSLYEAHSQGAAPDLPDLQVQYSDYAAWQRQRLRGDLVQLQFWRKQLLGAPAQLQLPTDRPRPALQSFKGATFDFDIPGELFAGLKAAGRVEGATLFMVCLAIYQILMARWSGARDVLIGTPTAGQRNGQTEGLVGMFVNMLALRTEVHDGLTFRQLLRAVKETSLSAYEHQDLPFATLVKELSPEREPSYQPIIQVVLAMQNYPQIVHRRAGLVWTRLESTNTATQFDLVLHLRSAAGVLSGAFEYATDLFDEQTVARMSTHFVNLLRTAVASPEGLIGDMKMLGDAERDVVLRQYNSTAVAWEQSGSIHEAFEKMAERIPDKIAIVCDERHVTYAQLNRWANQLAHRLRGHGVGPDQRVGVYMDRSIYMLGALLAILKAGGAYFSLDSSYPADRLAQIVTDSAPLVILTQQSLLARVPVSGAAILVVDAQYDEADPTSQQDPDAERVGLHPANVAYVIYTSGSTGAPKGVMVSHGNVMNLVRWHCAAFGLTERSRCSCVASMGFDASAWEIWPPLSVGATLVLASNEATQDPGRLIAWWAEQHLDVSFLPTPLAELAFQQGIRNEGLGILLVGGDRLRHCPVMSSPSLVNNYGPTETTVVATSGQISAEDAVLHIGRPMANSQVYILDRHMEPSPIGVTGEIYIGGAGVARGYLNRGDLTAERFLPDPFSNALHARMYRTGDLASWRSDGTVDFKGRNDEQVKIRGYRIAVEEVEARLERHGSVKEAVVIGREDSPGDKRLVAYLTYHDAAPPTVDELRSHMKESLPEYMIPKAFVGLSSLPLTRSGKLDRRALPAPDSQAFAVRHYEKPQGDVEAAIAGIWMQLLRMSQISREDSFFDLGGHSILAVEATYRINQSLGTSLKASDLYRHTMLRELAAHVTGGDVQDDSVELSREARLDESIVANPAMPGAAVRAIMLTGATGFVGRFMLAELLRETDAIIYCIVRAPSRHQAHQRLRESLEAWDLWIEECAHRIVALPGDLRVARFGLDDGAYDLLCRGVDTIYHCGTHVNHLESYATARAANVDSIGELLKIAVRGIPKPVNYLSTLSVFSSATENRPRVVSEATSIEREKHSRAHGYVASKWVAESLLMTARDRGIPCNIFRLGLVWADSEQGRFDQRQNIYRVMKSCLMTGLGIEEYRYPIAPAPVDNVARAVIRLAGSNRSGQGLFHISSHDRMTAGVFECCNEAANTSLELLPYYDWICEMKRRHRSGWSLPAVPLIEFAFSIDRTSFMESQRSIRNAQLTFDCSRSHLDLAQAGVVMPAFDGDSLRKCVEGMLARDGELRAAVRSVHRNLPPDVQT